MTIYVKSYHAAYLKNNIVDKSVIMAEADSLVRSIFKGLYKEGVI